jgi:hypothetical protein
MCISWYTHIILEKNPLYIISIVSIANNGKWLNDVVAFGNHWYYIVRFYDFYIGT